MGRRFVLSLVALAALGAGCGDDDVMCVRAIDCVESCGAAVVATVGCTEPCPTGSFDNLGCATMECAGMGGMCTCAGGCPSGFHPAPAPLYTSGCPQPCDTCGACSQGCCLPDEDAGPNDASPNDASSDVPMMSCTTDDDCGGTLGSCCCGECLVPGAACAGTPCPKDGG
jgi:hypothetical protein